MKENEVRLTKFCNRSDEQNVKHRVDFRRRHLMTAILYSDFIAYPTASSYRWRVRLWSRGEGELAKTAVEHFPLSSLVCEVAQSLRSGLPGLHNLLFVRL